jgi:hypothetical protein
MEYGLGLGRANDMDELEILKVIQHSQEEYYSSLFKDYGYSPKSVGSENLTTKHMRYFKLSQIFSGDDHFTLHDVGHGLGHYYDFLNSSYKDKCIAYSGSEICKDFVEFCTTKYPACKFYYRNLSEKPFPETYDYIVLGGTFYHIEENDPLDWKIFIESSLSNGFDSCNKGMSFNFITEFCDYFKNGLYYCRLDHIISFIAHNLSRFFVIDHSYPLYEFTIYVYKENYVKSLYPDIELKRYFK